MTSPCMVQGAKLRPGPLKICKAASRPTGFGENFSIRPAGRLKIFHQKPCTFSPRPYLPPETSKVKPPTRHKKKVNVMKKRTEIQQDLKRGFGSAPTGIKILVKWSLVGFMVYVAVRFVCAFVGGVVTGLGGILPTLVVLAVVFFLIRSVWRILFLSVLLLFIILFCVIF
ncbi:putative membrane protein [Bacteroides fragilis NCTC 9343]|uniref:Membrane protein n=2 Tax=Bacteroides fragilis TaxID=817 RepID=Q5L8P1_BACFN|nr:putative membrane protein [Bacteroides fragilis NCTC 9343]